MLLVSTQTLCADKDDGKGATCANKEKHRFVGSEEVPALYTFVLEPFAKGSLLYSATEWVSAWLERWGSYAEDLLVIGITLQMCHKRSRTRKPTIASSQVRYITHVQTPDKKALFPTYLSKTRNQK
jgi:hypothetical protein